LLNKCGGNNNKHVCLKHEEDTKLFVCSTCGNDQPDRAMHPQNKELGEDNNTLCFVCYSRWQIGQGEGNQDAGVEQFIEDETNCVGAYQSADECEEDDDGFISYGVNEVEQFIEDEAIL